MEETTPTGDTQPAQDLEVAGQPEAPEQPKTEQPVAPEPSVEQLVAVLGKMPEHELEKLPQILQFKTRFMTQKDREYKEREAKQRDAFARQQQERAQAEQILAWARTNPQEAGQAMLTNPEVRRQIDWAEEKIRTIPGSGQTKEQVAAEIANRIADHLNETHEGSGIDAHQFPELKDALDAFSKWRVEKEMDARKQEMKELVEAEVAERLGILQKQAPQPAKGASGTTPGGKRTFKTSEIADMSMEQWKSLEKEIDEAHREGRITED